MSTRAIIKATDERESWSLYCHGDGYPSYLGERVLKFAELAPKIDPNNHEHYERPSINNPYSFVPNVSSDADKFIAALAGYLWQQGYTSAYMTSRDARKELGADLTDVDYLYEVTFRDNKPIVSVYENGGKEFVLLSDEKLREELKKG